MRRLLECNFPNKYAFLTLTFKPSTNYDITDLDCCSKLFYDFKKRLQYYLKKNLLPLFQYIGVTEFQDSNNNGSVHYHFVCNLVEVPLNDLQVLWNYGWVNRKVIYSNPINNKKINHYMNKGILDERLFGRKKYLRSQGLKKPISIMIEDWNDFYQHFQLLISEEIESGTYQSNLYGEILYHNYYIDNAKELIDYVQEL